ncbi:MAG: FtsL-like putative cell division protein [Candidatus Magasanikbacteria bacterium]
MTIKSPNKKQGNSFFVLSLLSLLILGGLLYIYQYNSLANLRYKLKETKNKITKLKSHNAQLKQKLYKLTGPSKLEKAAQSAGLVKESNPKYLELSQWVSDSSY